MKTLKKLFIMLFVLFLGVILCSCKKTADADDLMFELSEDGTSYCVVTDINSLAVPNPNKRKNIYGSFKYVIIPNEYKGLPVTSIGSHAFSGCSNLSTITLPNSVTSIGANAFSNCSNLTSIAIPDSVTSIDSSAFSGCSNLSSITVDKNNKTYDSRNNCNAIIETSSNILIVGCKNTIISNSVTSIGFSAFYGCSNLTSIAIPDSVTSIGSFAFSGCSNLTSIVIPDSVIEIGRGAFEYCSSLTSIVIPESVTSIGFSAFYGCRSLTLIVIPESVTEIGSYAFQYCRSLTSIVIPNSVTSIGEDAFSGCSSLIIYCEKEAELDGWSSSWNSSNRPVCWVGQWHYDENGNPVPNA